MIISIIIISVILAVIILCSIRNDWNTVEEWAVEWEITYLFGDGGAKYAVYKIKYSETRKCYKLVCSGLDPRSHSEYNKALKRVIELNKSMEDKI